MSRGRPIVLSVLAACVLVALSGCASEPDQAATVPPLSPTSSSSPAPASTSPATSSSPAPSARPSAHPAATDVQQIVALSRDYFAERTKAMNTGDTTRLRSLAVASCPCNQFADGVDKTWKTGPIKAPGFYQVSAVPYPRATSETTGFSNVIYTLRAEVDYDHAGKVAAREPANSSPVGATLTLVKDGGHWLVSELVIND